MNVLIVEDDFTNRKVLQKLLGPYAECDIAVDGHEAVEAFRTLHAAGGTYVVDSDRWVLHHLANCMPNLVGQVLTRHFELSEQGVRIGHQLNVHFEIA